MKDLIIFDEQSKPSSFPESMSSEFVLFEEIREFEQFIHKNKSRYTIDQLYKLSQNLRCTLVDSKDRDNIKNSKIILQ